MQITSRYLKITYLNIYVHSSDVSMCEYFYLFLNIFVPLMDTKNKHKQDTTRLIIIINNAIANLYV